MLDTWAFPMYFMLYYVNSWDCMLPFTRGGILSFLQRIAKVCAVLNA
eukprot:gene28009-42615_t